MRTLVEQTRDNVFEWLMRLSIVVLPTFDPAFPRSKERGPIVYLPIRIQKQALGTSASTVHARG